eukprot:TCONS_00022207-protein
MNFPSEVPGRLCFILSRRVNKLICFYAGDRRIKAVRDAIIKCWSKGIKNEKVLSPECYQFKLEGDPFNYFGDNSSNKTEACNLYSEIINSYYKRGWKLIVGTIMSHRNLEDPILIFKKIINPSKNPLLSIAIDHFHIQLDNLPTDLIPTVTYVVENHLNHDIKKIKQDTDGTVIYKLKGMVGLHGEETWQFVQKLHEILYNNHYTTFGHIPLRAYKCFDLLFFQHSTTILDQELFTMYLLHGDTIELENSNHVINNAMVEVISEAWKGGIQKQSEDGARFKLKLKGYPFSTLNDMECLATDSLFANILEQLVAVGYSIDCSFTQIKFDKRIIFKRQKPVHRAKFMCLNTKFHCVRLVNAPDEIKEATEAMVKEMKLDMKKIKRDAPGCSLDMRFKNRGIWEQLEGHDTYVARSLLVALLGKYTDLQYQFILSADLTEKQGEGSSSWFFMYDNEQVTAKHQLKVESQSRSPSPNRHSAHNSPRHSPRSHHHHHRSRSPRQSPRVQRTIHNGNTDAIKPFSGSERHLLPPALVSEPPPSYEEATKNC